MLKCYDVIDIWYLIKFTRDYIYERTIHWKLKGILYDTCVLKTKVTI